ncbi:hypothetical protein J6590_044233 [Homalodisca vitripennis]|nr:hypothetical protein J6590_044233 [Homalodisca vitripennis]
MAGAIYQSRLKASQIARSGDPLVVGEWQGRVTNFPAVNTAFTTLLFNSTRLPPELQTFRRLKRSFLRLIVGD